MADLHLPCEPMSDDDRQEFERSHHHVEPLTHLHINAADFMETDDRLKSEGWVHKQINSIIADHYGKGVMAREMADYVAHDIASRGLDRTRVRRTLWEWYHDGALANDATQQIMDALSDE